MLSVILFISIISIDSADAQPIIARDKWGCKNIHIGLTDNNFNMPPQNWYLTFGNGGGGDYNFGMWGMGIFADGLNINRINSGNVQNAGNGVVYITSDWKFGIAVGSSINPQYTLDVRGEAIASQWLLRSDKRLKKDISPITRALNKISLLEAVSYRKDHKINTLDELLKKNKQSDVDLEYLKKEAISEIERQKKLAESDTSINFGFIAQELRKVYPELVFEDSEGMLSVNYTGLIPVLVESIKELQAQINQLKDGKPNANNISSSAILYQNTPNPFTHNTEIKYFLPDNSQNALICIYDLAGTQIKQYTLSSKGNASLIINGNEFKPGMYLYALLLDGKEIDTKKMILTQ